MLLAHDLGTTGDKASMHDDTGALIAAVTVRYPTRYGPGGVVEQAPEDWWDAVCSATRRLLEQTGTRPEEVEAVATSGQMMGVVLLDGHNTVLRPSLIWADTRSSPQCARLQERIGNEVGYRITGHQLNPTYSLSKLMWLRDHEPDVFGRAQHFCLAKDFLGFRLTGRLATDPSDASSTNAFDQAAGRWSTELLAAAEIESGLFPEIVPATTVLGPLHQEAAVATGLAVGTPVVLGGGDGPLAAVGAGIISAEDGAYAYLGSSSWVSMAADQPLLDLPSMRTMTFDHVVPGRYVPTATMQAGGGSLNWVTDLLSDEADPDRFRTMVAAARDVPAATEGLYFLPHLLGERSPYWNPRARGAFLGLSQHHGPGHLTRAVLEGVAFNLATCVEAFREGGAPVDRVDAIGGGAASDVWLQILADVWGCVVRRRSVVEEGNSLGAAVTAGVGVGLLSDFTVARRLSEVTAEFAPDPERHTGYVEAHAEFLDAYRRLEPWFDRVNR